MKPKHEVKSLPLAFSKDIYKDEGKKGLLPAKMLLRSLCSWPDSNAPIIVFATWFLFINLLITEIFHTFYVFLNLDNAINVVTTFTTVTTTLEALVRLHSLIFKKHIINDILYKIWKVFWPFEIIGHKKKSEAKLKLTICVGLPISFLFFAICSNSFITGMPFVNYHGLILNSVYPFDWNQAFVYEVIYVWQYYSDWFVLFMICGFDFLFVPLVMICATQFSVIQEVCRDIFTEESKRHRKLIFGDNWKEVTDRDLLISCLEQHKMLLEICIQLENSFNTVILIQYGTSVMSICSGILTLKLDRSQLFKMLMYSAGHLVQLFYYCFVGQELTFQSSHLSDAIYECNWHLGYDREFRKTLIMMIQRSQREQCLTAAGVLNLDFSGYLKVMRVSFSFYTLFDSVMRRRGL